MHIEAREYVEQAVRHHVVPTPDYRLVVLEIGGVNINGGVRDLVPHGHYISIDPEPGPGVDVVVRARDFTAGLQYDLVLCTEVLEHVEQPAEIIACAWRVLRPGGLLILTCASTGRPAHGARGAGELMPNEWYRNISPDELRDLLYAWEVLDLSYINVPGDARCVARKP